MASNVLTNYSYWLCLVLSVLLWFCVYSQPMRSAVCQVSVGTSCFVCTYSGSTLFTIGLSTMRYQDLGSPWTALESALGVHFNNNTAAHIILEIVLVGWTLSASSAKDIVYTLRYLDIESSCSSKDYAPGVTISLRIYNFHFLFNMDNPILSRERVWQSGPNLARDLQFVVNAELMG